jgi:DNA-binding NarL/FixJ family response regulator
MIDITSSIRRTAMCVHILIVDDSKLVRIVLKSLLEQHVDWRVCAEADNGEAAIAKAAETKPDIIILDFEMPVRNGLGAAREIGRMFPQVPMLMFTVHTIPPIIREAERVGIRHIVDKNDFGAMVSAIENTLGRAA